MTKPQISWQNIKPKLKNLAHTELLHVVSDLYALNNDNKHFLHARYQDSEDKLTTYKTIIRKALFPTIERNQNVEISVGRKAIRDYKKAVGDPKNTLELMVYYIECGNDFTLTYGDIGEAFYDSLISMFSDVVTNLKTTRDTSLLPFFLPRLQAVVHKAKGIGWGYYDGIADLLAKL